ncbi:MAG: tetratricopeptide repeat protein [Sterolibacteriaceae bacterium]|nr:tetratricopeptide repeat protein [Candidatus Methylophosphatis haderslevensis]
MANVAIFLSTVTAEFRSYRDALRRDLDRPNVTVKVQEDFIASGSETLDKLDDYIRQCDAVIHLVGDMTGASAKGSSVALIRRRYPDFAARPPALAGFLDDGAPALSYTQWEAWLALYHGKTLLIAAPEPGAPRDAGYRLDESQRAAQQAHLERLRSAGHYVEIRFANADRLAVDMLRSRLQEIVARAGPPTRPGNLPFRSIGDLFKGREPLLDALTARLGGVPETAASPLAATVLGGMGGVGKTRLTIEYAWRRAADYTALLFVNADSPESLQRNLAALCARTVLDLPEQAETDQGKQHEAVLDWLRRHPGWLLILDNIDSEPAAAAVEALLPQLAGGHALLTSRLANWSGSIAALALDVLSPEAAADFLLARTDGKRRGRADDAAQALQLAEELGGLALALEQAGAYIAQRRLGFAQYLAQWQAERDKVLGWYDPRLMQYPKSVAITWQTSFDQLGATARRLLERLAWLAPDAIPESLLDVAVPGAAAADADPFAALAELESYSLLKRAADTPGFSVHRLVQEVTRRTQRDDPAHCALVEALQWIDGAFVGDPDDVRDWPVLEPLAPHVRAVAASADAAGIAGPTAWLLNQLGLLLFVGARYAEAEPLMRRALAIDQASFGDDHPKVATHLNNLAGLLQDTNRLAEAEPLMRRALAIDEASFGAEHPRVVIDLNNLAALLQATNRLAEAEPLMRRALAIDQASFGDDHPRVAAALNNLAQLLQGTNRLAEAEPLMRRALAIDEASFGPDHPNVAIDLNNLAQLLQATNRLAEAEPLMRRALAIDEASFGAEHPDVARDLNNLAQLLQATNRLAEAEPLMRRALAIDEASFGADHPKVAIRLNNLAQLLKATNRLAEAEPLMRRALAIDEASFGTDHPNVATDLNNLAALLQTTNRLDEAEPLMRRALAIDQASFGDDHPDVARDLNNLAQLLQATNRLTEAEPLMRRALQIFVASLGSDHPNSQTVGGNYLGLLQAMGRTEDEIAAKLAALLKRP